MKFEIEDTGIGIPAEDRDNIFAPFFQVGATESQKEGSGLGLAISQQLVRLMGSELSVKSTPGQGSAFWFDLDLPVAVVEASSHIVSPASVEPRIIGYSGVRRKILVVDDNLGSRLMLKRMLVPLGFDLMEAGDGYEALNRVKTDQPDLILMDLVMPVLDGFETTRRIRALDIHIPIIGVSATVSESFRAESRAAGCNDFLAKPIQLKELLDGLQRLMQLTWLYQDAPEPETEEPPVEKMLMPPRETLEQLLEFAKGGYLNDVQAIATRLKTADPRLVPFIQAVEHLVENLQGQQLREYLQNALEATQEEC